MHQQTTVDSLPNVQQRAKKRRKVSPEFKQQFEQWRQQSRKYGDVLQHIDTVEMYERLDDKPADLIVAAKILEHLFDVDAALQEINKLARKHAVIIVTPDAIRSENEWRKLIGRRLTIYNDFRQGDYVVFVCTPGVMVEGIKVRGVLEEDERWQHVLASIARIKKRIIPVEAHGRRAILTCYGPSLKQTWPRLQEEMAEGNSPYQEAEDRRLWKTDAPFR